MAAHKAFRIAAGAPVYFCDPVSPWQRGSNENTDGLLRQYLPKAPTCPPTYPTSSNTSPGNSIPDHAFPSRAFARTRLTQSVLPRPLDRHSRAGPSSCRSMCPTGEFCPL
ncbi:MAG TPA: hypothetical protein H9881_11445 [Candidatus Stackebrandtia excrementipullorum]|nr:hypothetical protein [Candidatus Stackebrandtia excrementipullorum]